MCTLIHSPKQLENQEDNKLRGEEVKNEVGRRTGGSGRG